MSHDRPGENHDSGARQNVCNADTPGPSAAFRVGPYRAVEPLGVGSTAQTWAGVDERSGLPVALKVFPPGGLEAARQEATLAEVVDHPHLPTVLDVVADPDRPTLVTELATGGSLAALLARAGSLGVGETLTVLLPVASALATAHERQVVHGDVSTRNIVLDAVGRPLLIDLGAGRAITDGGPQVGVTPCHAAPEAAAGAPPTSAADVFALGSVARACLMGEPAWPATELDEVTRLADTGPWPDVPDSIGSAPLAALVRAMLRADPDRRPGAAALVVGLRAAGHPQPLPMAHPAGSAPLTHSGRSDGQDPIDPGDLDDLDDLDDVDDLHAPEGPGGPDRPDEPGHTTEGIDSGRRSEGRERPLGEMPDLAGAAQALTRARLTADPGRRPAGRTSPARAGGRRRATERSPGPSAGGRWVAAVLVAGALAGLAAATLGRVFSSEEHGPAAVTSPAGDGSGGSSVLAAGADLAAVPSPRQASAGSASPAPTPDDLDQGTVDPGGPSGTSGVHDDQDDGAATLSTPARPPVPADATGPVTGTGLDPGSSDADAGVDWLTVVRTLSAERGRAISSADPALLDLVYVAGPARAADTAVVEELRRNGTVVTGGAHEIVSAGVIGPVGPGTDRPTGSGLPGMRLLITDRLPSYEIRDAAGAVVGRTAARAGAALVMTVVRTEEGYRIEEVVPA